MIRFFTRAATAYTIALLALSSLGVLLGQSISSSIRGALVDSSGGALPGSQVTLTASETGSAVTVKPNDTGIFRILDVKPGTYSVHIEAPGFKAYQLNNINLASSETRDLGEIKLDVGSIKDEVTVTAEATPVQTASSERSALVDGNQVTDLSLKGRDVMGLLALMPGVVDTNTDRSINSLTSYGGATINGMAGNTKNVTLDGINAVANSNAGQYVDPSVDSIAEVRVIANGGQAEFGRNNGGTVNLIMKSGTRDFHGTGFWNRRHEDMDANTFFNNRSGISQVPIYRYFVGGGTIGGPVFIPKKFNDSRQKLFFFVSEEFTRQKVPTTTVTANLPTASELGGDFSNSRNALGAVIPILQPGSLVPFSGNIIPSSLIDPTGLALLKQLNSPNGYVNPAPGQQYSANYIFRGNGSRSRRGDVYRGDWAISSKLNVSARFVFDADNALTVSASSPGKGTYINFIPGRHHVVSATYAISPSSVNEFKVGLGQNHYGFSRPEGNEPYLRTATLSPPTLSPIPSGGSVATGQYFNFLPNMTFAGGQLVSPASYTVLGAFGSFYVPFDQHYRAITIQDDLSKIIGAHSLKIGVYFEPYNREPTPVNGLNYMGAFNFGSSVNNPLDTRDGYSNALLGVFQTYSQASRISAVSIGYQQLEGYLQDSWRVSRRLTLDLGVRWAHMGALTDTQQGVAQLFPGQWSAAQAPRIYWPGTVNGQNVAIDRATGTSTFFSLNGTIVPGSGNPVNGISVLGAGQTPNNLYNAPSIGFTPRIGLAWDATGDGKTAIRASAGTFYNRNVNTNYVQLGAAPTVYTPVVYYSYINQIPQAAASGAISPTTTVQNPGNVPLERALEVNFTVQRHIGWNTVADVGYVGNFDRHAYALRSVNPIPEFAYANAANVFSNTEVNPNLLRTAYPGLGVINLGSNSDSALNYHALQAAIQHKLTKGLQFGVSYTFSKALGSQPSATDPYNSIRGFYYGPLAQDRAQNLAVNYAYSLPGPPANWGMIPKLILGKWTLSGVTRFQTGAPVTPTCTSTSAGVINSDPSLSGVVARCREIADPSAFQQNFFNNFNTSAFALAAPGTFGTTGLGILRQPAWGNWDATLEKWIPVRKDSRKRIGLRVEAYNVFNHAEFSTIGTTYTFSGATNTNAQTGQYTATLNPRQMSTTLRFEF